MESRLWTVARYPAGTWDTGSKPSDPAYESCEVYQIIADSREQAKKSAQAVRARLVKKGIPLPTQAKPYRHEMLAEQSSASEVPLPISLPEGWTAEKDEAFGVIITAIGPDGHKGFVTVCETKRSFELGMSVVRQRKHYSGRYWRKELYEEAVSTLKLSMS